MNISFSYSHFLYALHKITYTLFFDIMEANMVGDMCISLSHQKQFKYCFYVLLGVKFTY